MGNAPLRVREIEHTGDLGIEVTAGDLVSLFSSAGEALYGFIADPTTIETREEISVSARGDGTEELLHAWLCELLAQFNLTGFVGKSCDVGRLTGDRVDGLIRGEKLDLRRHGFHTEIKGVTYHGFKVWEEKGLWRARVIFDV
jgi:SHS2 domain-containing protein